MLVKDDPIHLRSTPGNWPQGLDIGPTRSLQQKTQCLRRHWKKTCVLNAFLFTPHEKFMAIAARCGWLVSQCSWWSLQSLIAGWAQRWPAQNKISSDFFDANHGNHGNDCVFLSLEKFPVDDFNWQVQCLNSDPPLSLHGNLARGLSGILHFRFDDVTKHDFYGWISRYFTKSTSKIQVHHVGDACWQRVGSAWTGVTWFQLFGKWWYFCRFILNGRLDMWSFQQQPLA